MIHGALTITLKTVRPLSHITIGFLGLIIQPTINLLMKLKNMDSLIKFYLLKIYVYHPKMSIDQ